MEREKGTQPTERQRLPNFSSQERIILKGKAEGVEDLQIAQNLYVTINTVKTRVKILNEKLGTTGKGTTALVLKTLERDLIDPFSLEGLDLQKLEELTSLQQNILNTIVKNGGEKSRERDLAGQLFYSEEGIKTALKALYKRLGARDKPHATALFWAGQEARKIKGRLDRTDTFVLGTLTYSRTKDEVRQKLEQTTGNGETRIALLNKKMGTASVVESVLRGIRLGIIDTHILLQNATSELEPSEITLLDRFVINGGRNSSLPEIAMDLKVPTTTIISQLSEISIKLSSGRFYAPFVYLALTHEQQQRTTHQ